jgi:hypothetical protein
MHRRPGEVFHPSARHCAPSGGDVVSEIAAGAQRVQISLISVIYHGVADRIAGTNDPDAEAPISDGGVPCQGAPPSPARDPYPPIAERNIATDDTPRAHKDAVGRILDDAQSLDHTAFTLQIDTSQKVPIVRQKFTALS